MEPGEPLIEVVGLEKTYEDESAFTPALSGVDFTIRRGEFVAVMGPSGSGKSTLMHVLSFLDRPSGGTYRFLGSDINQLTDQDLARYRNEEMGFVFQSFNLLSRSTVYENVELPLIYSGVTGVQRRDMVMAAVDSVGLSEKLDVEAGKLSGGQKQRVAIARALVNNPAVIFADEPTGNLDSVNGAQVMEIFSHLNKMGRTIILVTHETYTAEYAGRVLKLHDGKLVMDAVIENRRSGKDAFFK
jgi:putative ABC transport system ATP-binding protein